MDKDEVFNMTDPPNSLKDQLINAIIMAGYSGFSTLVGLGATGLLQDPKTGAVAAAISAGFTFFASLVTQRGLKKPEG